MQGYCITRGTGRDTVLLRRHQLYNRPGRIIVVSDLYRQGIGMRRCCGIRRDNGNRGIFTRHEPRNRCRIAVILFRDRGNSRDSDLRDTARIGAEYGYFARTLADDRIFRW